MNTEQLLGKEQVAVLLARYAEGSSANSLAIDFGVPTASILRIVRKHGTPVHDLKPSAEVIAHAAELYRSGLSVQKVADQGGLAKSTTLRELKKAGVVMRQFRRVMRARRLGRPL